VSNAHSTPSPDFSLLRSTFRYRGPRNQRVMLLLAGLLLLLISSAITLVVYLQTFESEEQVRTQSADALWLEENVRFHLRRLEGDLESLAKRALEERDSAARSSPPPGGSLRSYEGGLLAHAWQPADSPVPPPLASLWKRARLDPLNEQALDSMQDVATGLRRPAYAGPLSGGKSAPADEMWLCVPIFDRGEFLGSYVAVFSLSKTLELIVPAWFRKTHRLEVLDPGAEIQLDANDPHRTSKEQRFLASIDMPGSDTYLQIYAIDAPHATVPRALLGVALAFLVGMIASLVFLRRDIEKRQAVEDSLAAQVALRRSMEDSIDVGLFARDLGGVILYANRAFCAMVGCRDDALLGTTESLPGWPEPDHGREEAEIEFRCGDGRVVTLLIHMVPLVHANGRQIGWINSVLDISDRRKAEKAAQVQQQRLESAGRLVAIGEVASTLAHELNQPLGALSSFANGLLNRMRKGNIEPLQVESIVERINALAEKTGGIIRRVNAFARRREMQKESVDLAAFLRACYPTAVIAPGVRLELGLPSARVFVKADVVLLEQALRNVVQNAAEAAVSVSATPLVRVELALSSDGTEASISVSDNGAGIDEDARARIFDAFYSSKAEGMGMGLAICRSILEAHHGRIELLDDRLHGGACFRFSIPVND